VAIEILMKLMVLSAPKWKRKGVVVRKKKTDKKCRQKVSKPYLKLTS
jgi:hypothetical protein